MATWLISRFIVIYLYGERWFFKWNLAKILPLKSKLSRKIQRFSVADKTMEMLKTSWTSKSFFFFHEHSRFSGQQGKGEGIYLTALYHFHPFHRHLDISRAITAEKLKSFN